MIDKTERPPLMFHDANGGWADWLVHNRKKVAIIFACIVLIAIACIWIMQSSKARAIKDFETADILAEELHKNPPLFEGQASEKSQTKSADMALSQLKEIVDRNSILQPRFDSLIAEEMLLRNKQNEIDPYAKRSISRLRAIGLDEFADFSEVSRLAGEQQYKTALKKAQDLKKVLAEKYQAQKNTLGENTSDEFMLESFLLLHIATLNQLLGNHEAMLQAIIELKEHLGLTKRDIPFTSRERELASKVLAHLQEHQNSLLEFIEEMPEHVGS